METQRAKFLDEFFEKDSIYDTDIEKYRRSSLLSIINDLKYLLGIQPRAEIKVSGLSIMELLLTCFDMLARVWKHSTPKPRENSEYFQKFLRSKHCKFTKVQALKLWELRNSVLHSYNLALSDQGISLISPNGKPLIITTKNTAFYLIPIYIKLINAKKSLYNYIESKSPSTQSKYIGYISKYGFFYQTRQSKQS